MSNIKPIYISEETMKEMKQWFIKRGIPQRLALARRKERKGDYVTK